MWCKFKTHSINTNDNALALDKYKWWRIIMRNYIVNIRDVYHLYFDGIMYYSGSNLNVGLAFKIITAFTSNVLLHINIRRFFMHILGTTDILSAICVFEWNSSNTRRAVQLHYGRKFIPCFVVIWYTSIFWLVTLDCWLIVDKATVAFVYTSTHSQPSCSIEKLDTHATEI